MELPLNSKILMQKRLIMSNDGGADKKFIEGR